MGPKFVPQKFILLYEIWQVLILHQTVKSFLFLLLNQVTEFLKLHDSQHHITRKQYSSHVTCV